MRHSLSLTGLTAVCAALLIFPHASAATTPSSRARQMLLAVEQRLQDRLEDRGIFCDIEPDRFGCGTLRRLHDRIERMFGSSSSSSSSSRSSLSSTSSRSSSSSSAVSSSSSSSQSAGAIDPMSDTTLSTSLFALFGDTTPIVASIRAFINEEPLHVTYVRIAVTGSSSVVEYFSVYDQERRLLGRASKNGSEYVLPLPVDTLVIPRKEYRSFYVRAHIGEFDRHADGEDAFGVLTVTLEGVGEWSNDTYVKPFSDNFPIVQPSAAVLTGLRNGGALTEFLTEGPTDLLDLRGAAKVTGGLARARFDALTFTVAKSDVTLSNVSLAVIGSGVSSPCTVNPTTVVCDNIPASLGTVSGDFRLVVQGNVAITAGSDNPRLQLFLQNPGTPSAAGDVEWSDGISDYTWLPFATPVLRGTYFTR